MNSKKLIFFFDSITFSEAESVIYLVHHRCDSGSLWGQPLRPYTINIVSYIIGRLFGESSGVGLLILSVWERIFGHRPRERKNKSLIISHRQADYRVSSYIVSKPEQPAAGIPRTWLQFGLFFLLAALFSCEAKQFLRCPWIDFGRYYEVRVTIE